MSSKNANGLVMEVQKNKVIIMTNCGEFKQIKIGKNVPKIGEEYRGIIYEKHHFYTKSFIAACIIFIIVLTSGLKTYYTEACEVVVDINPSIKLMLNRFDKIIKAEALNEDGEKVLKVISVKNKSLDDGLKIIIEEAKDEKYIDDKFIMSGKVISITVNNKKSGKSVKLKNFTEYADKNNLSVKLNKKFISEHGKTNTDIKKQDNNKNKINNSNDNKKDNSKKTDNKSEIKDNNGNINGNSKNKNISDNKTNDASDNNKNSNSSNGKNNNNIKLKDTIINNQNNSSKNILKSNAAKGKNQNIDKNNKSQNNKEKNN